MEVLMNTFNWLLVGHLVGDWVLQNEWMVLHKKQAWFTWPGFTHFAIYTLTIYGALWLSGERGLTWVTSLVLLALIFFSHWVVDATHLVQKWMQFYGKGNSFMVEVMVDQTLHIVVLVGIVNLLPLL